jgi:hypothetical protein
MHLFVFLVWLQMSAQPQIQQMYDGMCSRATEKWQVEGDYGSIRRYSRIKSPDTGECFIYRRNFGQVYWRGPHGEAILFPIGSPLDDITRAEFAEAAQRAADETDGKSRQKERVWCTAQNGCVNAKGEQVTPPHGICPYGIECPAEPVDVPAVQGKQCLTNPPKTCWLERSTCADKSRVLLTSEDGKKHCVKF